MKQRPMQQRLRVVVPRLQVVAVAVVVPMVVPMGAAVGVGVAADSRLRGLAAVQLALASMRLWLQRGAAWVCGPSRL